MRIEDYKKEKKETESNLQKARKEFWCKVKDFDLCTFPVFGPTPIIVFRIILPKNHVQWDNNKYGSIVQITQR